MSTTNIAFSDDDDEKIPFSHLYSPSYRHRQSPPSTSRVQARPLCLPIPPPLISRANLGEGDLVWAKAFPYTYRPGVIRSCKKKRMFLVSFFGDEDEEPRFFLDVEVVGFEENYVRMIRICGWMVKEDIADALEEFGQRTVLGLMCSDRSGKIKVEEVSSVRKGFVPRNLVRFVRRKGVFCAVLDGDINEDGGLEMIKLAAQVVAFRRFVTFGGIIGNFASRQLLGLVRELGIGFGRFQSDVAYMEKMIERVLAFRRFLSVSPDWVLRELVETRSGLFKDDSESSTSESYSDNSGSGMSICEGKKLQSPDISGISSLSGFSFDEHEVPQSSKGFRIGLEKEDLMVDDCGVSDGYETLRTCADELLPPVRSSTNEDLPSDINSSLLLRVVLKDLYIIATDLCYLGVEKCESVYGCILTFRKLTVVESTSNLDYPRKLRRRNRLRDKKPEQQFSFSAHTFQNDEIDMIKHSDYLIGDAGHSACDNLNKNTGVYVEDSTLTFTVDKCQEALDEILVFQVDQSDENKWQEVADKVSFDEIDDDKRHVDSSSETETNLEGVVIVTAVNKQGAIFITPNVSSVEPLPEIVSSLSECKTSYAREMLVQLHSIAANPSFVGQRRCKIMCTKWLKVRELIYQNNSCFLSRSDRVFGDNLMKPTDRTSTMENEQLSKLDGNMNNDQVFDYIISGNGVLGGRDPYTFQHDSAPTCSDSSGSTLFTEIDGLGVVSSVCIVNRAYPLSWVPENQVPASEVVHRTSPVIPVISPPICELLSQLCLLAIDIYHPGAKRVKFIRSSIFRYRNLMFQNMQDLFSPTNNNRCDQSSEGFHLCRSDKLMDDSCVTGTCSGDTLGSVNKPKKDTLLVYIAQTENEFSDKVRTRNTFTVDSQSSPSVHRNVDENGLDFSSGDASRSCEGSLEKKMIDHETTTVSTPELLGSRCFNSEDSLISVNIQDSSSQTNIKKFCLKVEKFQVPLCDKLMHDSRITETYKGNKPNDVNMPNKDAQFVPYALNVNELGDKVKAGHSTSDAIDSQSSPILHINVDANGISCENHSKKLDISLGNAFGSCDENMMMEQPASTGNLEQLNIQSFNTEDEDFDSIRKCSANTDDVITWTPSEVVPSKNTCSQINVYTPKVMDGKNSIASSSCESASTIDRKRKAIYGHSLVDQSIFIYQSKLKRVQYVASAKLFYASPLVANNSNPPSSNVQKLVDNNKRTGLSMTLKMKFPRGVKLPSKEQLEKKFSMFGLLDHSRTRIFFYTGVAQIVFLHLIDAQTAYRYVSRKKSFIHSDMHFWLVHDEKLRQEIGGQILPLIVGGQPKLKIKSCLRRPNINGEKNPKQKKRVRFSVDNLPSSSIIRRDATCGASVSDFPRPMMEDILGPLLQLLVKCDSLVEEAKEKLGSKAYYSCLYIQLLSCFRTDS